jgi:hypothetical protein
VQDLLIAFFACAEPYGQGIVNAQLSVLKGLEAAKRHRYTFVVPHMVQWWAPHDPSYILILPFSHFYDQEHFESFAEDYGAHHPLWLLQLTSFFDYPSCTQQGVSRLHSKMFCWPPTRIIKVLCGFLPSMCTVARKHDSAPIKKRSTESWWCAGVDLVWELPPNRHTACTLQIQLSDKSPQAVNKATHNSWASEYGVICLGGSSTFFTIDGADEPQFWPPDGLRAALKPSGDLQSPLISAPSLLRVGVKVICCHPPLSNANTNTERCCFQQCTLHSMSVFALQRVLA